jgi:branched-chain amino acid transport system permease protein
LVRGVGQLLSVPALQQVDLQLWRWFFFGATLIIVMLLRPEGLFPSSRRAAELHAEAEEASDTDAAVGSPQA